MKPILAAVVAAAVILSACPGCIVLFRKEYVPVPDPEADSFVPVEVRGPTLRLPDGSEVHIAGADLSGLSPFQRDTFSDHLAAYFPKGSKALLLPAGTGRARVIWAEPMGRGMPYCSLMPVISLLPIKVCVPPRRVDVLAELLERGRAKFDPRQIADPDVRRAYSRAETWAKGNRLGIWAGRDEQLHFAVQKGAQEEVLRLLAAGANIDARGKHRFTALHFAAQHADPAMIDLLIHRGADPSAMADYRQTPLYVAARFGRKGNVERLLCGGVSVDSASLQWAAVYGQMAVVKLLLARGAEIPASTGDEGLIGSLSKSSHLEIVHLLLVRGAPMDARRHGPEILLSATLQRRGDLVALLLDRGVDPNAPDRHRNRPMDVAAASGMVGIAKLLIAHGADVNLKDRKGRRPLRLARKGKHSSMVALLRGHGAR
ncbi:hypothetical protein LCGC14_2014740 [marine sediment metagenome]|uniref:Uncharacterized protein n=1 Tax=marine sediment metagenome TaxID=412755 RepID=A0A0F9EZA5_9ZZZZ